MSSVKRLAKSLFLQQGKNTPQEIQGCRIELATVQTAPPNLSILVDGLSIPFEKEFLIVDEHLTRHKRTVTIKNTGGTKLYSSTVQDLYPTEPPQQSQNFAYIHLDNGEFEMVQGEIEFLDELKPGDRVIVASYGSQYFILSRAVTY